MNYLTKTELEEITRELLENPTRETIKKLNEKYNGSSKEEIAVKEIPVMNLEGYVQVNPEEPVQNTITEPQMPTFDKIPVVEPISVVPNESQVMGNIQSFSMPITEAPKVEPTIIANENNQPINFSGNLFETTNQAPVNLMPTMDNFNTIPNTMPNTEVPVSPVPFFGPHTQTTNNPIPVEGPMNNMQNNGPTMFGQFEQNYM